MITPCHVCGHALCVCAPSATDDKRAWETIAPSSELAERVDADGVPRVRVVPAADLLAAQAEIEMLRSHRAEQAARIEWMSKTTVGEALTQRDQALAALRETFHAGVYVLDCPRPSLDNAFARLSAVLKRTEALLAKMKREGV